MKKIGRKVRSRPKSRVISKGRKPVAKQVPAKREFIGRLKGIIRIVGDIESPVEPPDAWECSGASDLERINQADERLNSEAADVLDHQAIGRLEFSDVPKNAGKSARATRASRSIPAPGA